MRMRDGAMSRPGTPYDNAIMEKFWNDFKVEWWDKQHSYTLKEAIEAIKAEIDYFNLIRRSETINGHNPREIPEYGHLRWQERLIQFYIISIINLMGPSTTLLAFFCLYLSVEKRILRTFLLY
ncbi:integrase core domain-containing protein [Weissella paramesenteroides]|uniref:integrase core domain-containing protein n=1 Tax=Weissella paramesenteroides TaxID=1249 RepID=UPI003F221E00